MLTYHVIFLCICMYVYILWQIDNIIVLSDGLRYDGPDGAKIEEFLKVYRHLINPDVLFVSIDLSSNQTGLVTLHSPYLDWSN